ncbi:MAG: GAF domain-containing protein, partial [Chloroflexi bacterium]
MGLTCPSGSASIPDPSSPGSSARRDAWSTPSSATRQTSRRGLLPRTSRAATRWRSRAKRSASSGTTSRRSTWARSSSRGGSSRSRAGRSIGWARSPRRSPPPPPRCPSVAPPSRGITSVLDDKVALVLVKLGHLAVQKDREAYLRGLVDLCSQAVDAERCTVYIVNQKKRELWARVAQRTATEIRLPMGQGLAGQSALTGETINVPDAYADARFDRNVDLRTGFRTLNMLVVPVWGSDGQSVVGVIQALNKRNGAFERRDQMLLEQIAETVGPVLE